MNRRILIQMTFPAAIIGLVLFITCLITAWIVSQLQVKRSTILTHNVTSLEAAQQMEILVRRLRFTCMLYLLNPDQSLLKEIDEVSGLFQDWLDHAKRSAKTEEESAYVQQIQVGYNRYRKEFERLVVELDRSGPLREYDKLSQVNPIRHVIEPCDQLLRINKEMMVETSQESDRLSKLLRIVLVLLGLVGPLSGLIMGYAMARGLSRSMYQLSVHVHDVAQRLDQAVASVSVAADGDPQNLDQQLQHVVHRVEQVAQRFQQQQQELLRTQQLSAVGQLGASVAHEVRNPLTSIKMLVESALRSRNHNPLNIDDLKVIYGEVERMELTVQHFLNFARLPTPRRSPCDLREIVAQSIDLVRARARQQEVEIIYVPPEPTIWADVDQNQLCTVLVNLFINALDVMPSGGQLEIELEQTEDGIRLMVSDTGAGIPTTVSDQLFTPFISTKQTGSGLGLSISQRIIKEHDGTIQATNRPNGGAIFTIELPLGSEQHVQLAKT